MSSSPQVRVRAVDARVRPVTLRLPFRFGANTLTACPQLFVRVEVETASGALAPGWSAELMVPKWFDKRPAFSPAQNVEHLAQAVRLAMQAYAADNAGTPFGLFARHYNALLDAGREAGLTDLSIAFGQSMLDRAVIDALCGALGVSFFQAAASNLFGLCDVPIIDDMRGWDWDQWLATLRPRTTLQVRHTVGLLDDIEARRFADDGAPVSLRAAIERHGLRYFKLKLGGDPDADIARARAVLEVLAREVAAPAYTLDGNEVYSDRVALRELLAGLRNLPAPLYIEQPLPRDQSLVGPLSVDASPAPLLMDEADGTLDAFPRGRACGWTGVSSKACKGIYKALINRARCERWNREQTDGRYFMSAEDLTCQAGISVQQDLALVALLGLEHGERNGHYFGYGLAAVPAPERAAFVRAHPDLYDAGEPRAPLRIERGAIRIDSLFGTGFAHQADPDPDTLQPLGAAAALV